MNTYRASMDFLIMHFLKLVKIKESYVHVKGLRIFIGRNACCVGIRDTWRISRLTTIVGGSRKKYHLHIIPMRKMYGCYDYCDIIYMIYRMKILARVQKTEMTRINTHWRRRWMSKLNIILNYEKANKSYTQICNKFTKLLCIIKLFKLKSLKSRVIINHNVFFVVKWDVAWG